MNFASRLQPELYFARRDYNSIKHQIFGMSMQLVKGESGVQAQASLLTRQRDPVGDTP